MKRALENEKLMLQKYQNTLEILDFYVIVTKQIKSVFSNLVNSFIFKRELDNGCFNSVNFGDWITNHFSKPSATKEN